jgi:muramidase (phage lysozyme)
MSPNLKAFLDMIAISELGPELLAATDNGYNVLVGALPNRLKTFNNGYADHPNILVAVNSKGLTSTAAGRYQFLHRTWLDLADKLKLKDFSPASQDAACVQLVRESRALPDVEAGNFADAVAKCNHIWASLTGSPYGQHTHPIEYLQDAYINAGGSLVQ